MGTESPGHASYRWLIIPSFRASGLALLGFLSTLGLLTWWIGWNSNRLFLADVDAPGTTPPGTCEEIWARCSDDEKNVLAQLVEEHIANPYQRPILWRCSTRACCA